MVDHLFLSRSDSNFTLALDAQLHKTTKLNVSLKTNLISILNADLRIFLNHD